MYQSTRYLSSTSLITTSAAWWVVLTTYLKISNKHSVKKVKRSAELEARRKQKEAVQIKHYNALNEKYLARRKAGKYDKASFELSGAILKLNPEYYSVWNFRREILTNGLFKEMTNEEKQKLLDGELVFLEQILIKFPKVYWIWNHRKWCFKNSPVPNWKREIGLVNKMLELDARNFHVWHYRRYVVAEIEKATGKSLVNEEFAFTTTKINANFSNFSAWHNRAKLIPRLLQENSDINPTEFYKKELDYIRQAIYTDPDDQSSWIYQEWLITKSTEIVKDQTIQEQIETVENEIQSIRELYEVEPDSKWCIYSLVYYQKYLSDLNNTKLEAEELNSVVEKLDKLIEIDPKRKQRYIYLKGTL